MKPRRRLLLVAFGLAAVVSGPRLVQVVLLRFTGTVVRSEASRFVNA